jgi:hypothetical protein
MHSILCAWVLAASAVGGGGDDVPEPQGRTARAPKGGGPRFWMETEVLSAKIEASKASGTDPDFDNSSDFNDSIDTTLQQAIPWLAGGYELDFGLTIYAKLGFAYTTLIQDIGSGSVLGPPDIREGGGLDPYLAFGFGAGFRREVSPDFLILGRFELTMGTGDFKDYVFQDTRGDGDYTFQRVEFKVAGGYQLEALTLYAGARYNLITMNLDLEENVPGPESFDADFEFATPFGVFIGACSRLGERTSWHMEIGFVDALSVEVGAGLDF